MCCPSSYACLYKDVRNAVDLCHRDGSLKQKVATDPRRYRRNSTSYIVFSLGEMVGDGRGIILNIYCMVYLFGG